jgi:hypothetical protein
LSSAIPQSTAFLPRVHGDVSANAGPSAEIGSISYVASALCRIGHPLRDRAGFGQMVAGHVARQTDRSACFLASNFSVLMAAV